MAGPFGALPGRNAMKVTFLKGTKDASAIVMTAARDAGVQLYSRYPETIKAEGSTSRRGPRLDFRLAPGKDGTFYRRSHSGRRVYACCAHGHREFAEALFEVCPGAVIRSAMGKVTADNLDAMDMQIRGRNIGSQFMPLYYGEACDCGGY